MVSVPTETFVTCAAFPLTVIFLLPLTQNKFDPMSFVNEYLMLNLKYIFLNLFCLRIACLQTRLCNKVAQVNSFYCIYITSALFISMICLCRLNWLRGDKEKQQLKSWLIGKQAANFTHLDSFNIFGLSGMNNIGYKIMRNWKMQQRLKNSSLPRVYRHLNIKTHVRQSI